MKPSYWIFLLALLPLFASLAPAQKIKVIVDQDAREPGTSDQPAILAFLQSEKFDVLASSGGADVLSPQIPRPPKLFRTCQI
jgi:hypothetical protein